MSSTTEVDSGVDVLPARSSGVLVQMRLERDTIVPVIAAALILLHLGLRIWVSVGGWLFREDFLAAANLAGQAVDIPGPPGAVAIAQSVASVTPLSWSAIVGLEIAAQAMIALLLYRLLVDLFGRRPAILLPLTVYLTSSLPLVGGLWWTAAVVQLPIQLALLVVLSGNVRHLRGGQPGPAWTSALAVAIGLQFSLIMALIPLVLASGALLWDSRGTLRDRLRAVAQRRLVWLTQLLALVLGLTTRLLLADEPLIRTADLLTAVRSIPDLFVHTVLPGMVGGPWAWSSVAPPLAVSAAPPALVWAAIVVAIAVVVSSVLVHRGALRAWFLTAVLVAAVIVVEASTPAGLGRAGSPPAGAVPPGVLALAVALGLGLAFLPIRGGSAVLCRRTWTGRPVGARITGRFIRSGVGVAIAATLAVSCVVSTLTFGQYWSNNAARGYVAAAQASLVGQTDLIVADVPVPDAVIPGELAPANTTSTILAGLPAQPRFLSVGEIAYQLAVLDDDGTGQLAYVDAVSTSLPGPDPDCGWLVGAEPVTVPLPRATTAQRWIVQISYFTGQGNAVQVAAGAAVGGALIASGLHDLYFQVDGSVDDVVIEVENPASPICVGSVSVGHPRALAPGGR